MAKSEDRGYRIVGLAPKQTRAERRELRRAVHRVTKATQSALRDEEGWGFVIVVAKAVGTNGEAWDQGLVTGGSNFVDDAEVRDLLESVLGVWPKGDGGG